MSEKPVSEIGEKISLIEQLGEGVNKTATPPPSSSVIQDKDRVTITGHIHHEHYGDPPHSVDFPPCSYFTETQGEVYKRRIRVGQEWKPLPLGWFAEDDLPVGLIVIVNLEGTVIPRITQTEEEKAAVERRIINVSVCIDTRNFILIPPRLVLPIVVCFPKKVRLCCLCGGEARCAIHIFPK